MRSILAIIATLVVAGCLETGAGSNSGSTALGRSGYSPAYDFSPPENLAARLPAVGQLRPLTVYAQQLRARTSRSEANQVCNWISSERFPTPQRILSTYASESLATSSGDRLPFAGNKAFQDGAFYATRASAHLISTPSSPVRREFASALLANARAQAGLDTSALTRNGRPFTPDVGAALIGGAAWAISYLIVEDTLPLSADDREEVETWLDALLKTYIDGYRRWIGPNDLRGLYLIAHSEMALALVRNDPALFNKGAKEVARFISWTRADGSHRFGTSRGNRAIFYQGVSLDTTMESIVLLESQGIPAREIFLPTAERMALFWARAQQDQSLVLAYAKEQESVSQGSDYRIQERVEYAAGGELLMAMTANDEARSAVRQVSNQKKRFPTAYSSSFNATCIAAGLR